MAHKNMTLRLPFELYQRVVGKRRKSFNAFVVEAIEEKIEKEREEELRKGLRSLAGSVDPEEFAFWMEAQRKAMQHVDD